MMTIRTALLLFVLEFAIFQMLFVHSQACMALCTESTSSAVDFLHGCLARAIPRVPPAAHTIRVLAGESRRDHRYFGRGSPRDENVDPLPHSPLSTSRVANGTLLLILCSCSKNAG